MKVSEEFLTYLATLAALVLIMLIAFAFAALSGAVLGKFEAFGLGTVTGGLIGLLRGPSRAVVAPGAVSIAPVPAPLPAPVVPAPVTGGTPAQRQAQING